MRNDPTVSNLRLTISDDSVYEPYFQYGALKVKLLCEICKKPIGSGDLCEHLKKIGIERN